MPTNLKKLAQELNLSIATISRALQDSHEVSSETKKKVWALAEKLNYIPNFYASSLRKQSSKTIAVIIPEIANSFFTMAITGIEEIARANGYHVLIYLTHENVQEEISIIRHLQCGRVDGVLMSVSRETLAFAHLFELQKKDIPVVFFDRVSFELNSAKVTTDDCESGYKATEHLIESGCKRIAYLQISKTLSIGKRRMDGYTQALNRFNFNYDEELVVNCGINSDENYEIIKRLLASANPPDGIFASVENLAITTYYVCNDLNIPIPGKIKIISFSNLSTVPLLNPSLTTITQPAFDIGKEASLILFHKLKKKTHAINDNVILKSTLIKRNSTKPF